MEQTPDAATLLDLTQDKVAVIDDRGVYRFLNAAAGDLLGYDPDELVGTDAFDRLHPDDEPRLRASFERIVAGDPPPTEPIEYRYATADGDWLWLQSELHPPEHTGIDGYVLSSRDVTAEVESIRRLETIVAKSPDVLWMFDADWSELLFVNESVEAVFGIPPAELRERPCRFVELVHPDDRARVERAMERLSAGETARIDYRIQPPDDEIRWLRVPAEPVFEDGEVVAVSGFTRDVTDEYRRNRQLAVMDNLLRHTIRNDMNIVMGTAERIAEQTTGRPATDAETVRRVAEQLTQTAEKQRDVIDLLSQGGSPCPVAVEPLVRESIAAARAAEPSGAFSVSCQPAATALALPELDHAISELVENAVEHAESTPVVHVEVTVSEATVAIAVRDNCPPVPAEERHVIADQWEMDDLRHTDGMGLWLVYWIAERSKGRLDFDTHPNGNVVTVTVPRAHDAAAERVFGGGSVADGDTVDAAGEDTAADSPPPTASVRHDGGSPPDDGESPPDGSDTDPT